jgi:hypothetical protein
MSKNESNFLVNTALFSRSLLGLFLFLSIVLKSSFSLFIFFVLDQSDTIGSPEANQFPSVFTFLTKHSWGAWQSGSVSQFGRRVHALKGLQITSPTCLNLNFGKFFLWKRYWRIALVLGSFSSFASVPRSGCSWPTRKCLFWILVVEK